MSDVLSRVLLIEDDEGDALLVRECLLEAGVPSEDVIWERTLSDGIAALSSAPGCVLLDLGLPDAEGLGALHRLVSRATATPIIVLTGRNDRTGVDAVAAGAQDYLVKDDITPELLDRSIRYAVERTRAQTTELQLRAEQMTLAENARLERGLLPRPVLRSSLVSCATYYQPGRNLAVLGGDFFDVVETSDGVVRAVIGDVMGHGPDEAALGVHLRVAWRTLVLAGVPDEQILATLSQVAVCRERRHRRLRHRPGHHYRRLARGNAASGRPPAAAAVHRRRLVLPAARRRPSARRRGLDRRRSALAGDRRMAGLAHPTATRRVTDPLHRRIARRLPDPGEPVEPGRRRIARRDECGTGVWRVGFVVDTDDRRQRTNPIGRRHCGRRPDRPRARGADDPTGCRPLPETGVCASASPGDPSPHWCCSQPCSRSSSSHCSTSRARATTSSAGGNRPTRPARICCPTCSIKRPNCAVSPWARTNRSSPPTTSTCSSRTGSSAICAG